MGKRQYKMKTDRICTNNSFGARIVIKKINLAKTIGEQNLGLSSACSGGVSSTVSGAFGSDCLAHQDSVYIPQKILESQLFDNLREVGHSILNKIMKNNPHNSYDDLFFSSVTSGTTPYASHLGLTNLRKGFEEYTRKFPT